MNATPTERSLVGLAILKVNWERLGRDYLESFVPLAVEVIRTLDDDAISLPLVQDGIRKRFGLHLPQNPLRAVLQRAARDGFLRRDQGVFYRDRVKCASINFSDVESEATRAMDALVAALVDYASASQNVVLTSEDAESALTGFLATEDWRVLFTTYDREPLTSEVIPPQSTLYLVSAFVREKCLPTASLRDALDTVAKGNMLATALFLSTPGQVQKKFRATSVYLDTSIVIYFLGYGGDDRRAPIAELMELLRANDAQLRVMPDTVAEVRRVLNACAARIRRNQLRDAYGPTIDYFLSQDLTAGDIELLIARFPEKLRAAGILEEEPPALASRFDGGPSGADALPVLDERALETFLQREVGYKNPDARRHDVATVSTILRMRGGRQVYELESSRAIFLTMNVTLARAAKEYCRTDGFAGQVPPCITDYALGNILWLKSPTSAPDLPRKLLIADAFAATQPSDELWKLYLAEIAKLKDSGEVSDADYYVLRHSSSARAAVMQLTKGEEQAFSEGTVSEVLAIARDTIRADLKEQLDRKDDELANLKREQEALATANALVVADEKQRTGELEAQLAGTRAEAQRRSERIEARAQRAARIVLFAPKVAAAGTLLVATALTFPVPQQGMIVAMPSYLRSGLLMALFVFTVYAGFFGTPVKSLLDRAEARVARTLRGWLE